MSTTVVLHLTILPDHLDAIRTGIQESLKATREFDGCQSITLHQDQDDPCSLVLLQQWDSRDHYQKYYDYVVSSGAMEQMMPAFSAEPVLKFLDAVDA